MDGRERALNIPAGVAWSLAAIVGVHLLRSILPPDLNLELLLRLAFVPARYVPGASDLPGGTLAAVMSPVTYMLIHGDAVHLIINSLWMLAFGSAVARRIGSWWFLIFSVACGIAGALTHLVLHFGDLMPVVGASAAISGQMAGALRLIFGAGRQPGIWPGTLADAPLASLGYTLRNPRMLTFIAVWVMLNLVFGLGILSLGPDQVGIAWEAHIGGFLLGLVTFGYFDQRSRHPRGPVPLD